MHPYLLIVAAAIFLGIAVWFKLYGKVKGEQAWLFFIWLVASAATALFSALSWWIGDITISRSFQAAALGFMVTGFFSIFLFARSFDHKLDFTVLFWSVPYQFYLAGIIMNHEIIHVREGGMWVLGRSMPVVWAGSIAMLFYMALAIVYIARLYLTLRRESRKKEVWRVRIILVALVILFAANILGDAFPTGSWVLRNIPLVAIGDLAGSLLLVFAFIGVREDGGEEVPEEI